MELLEFFEEYGFVSVGEFFYGYACGFSSVYRFVLEVCERDEPREVVAQVFQVSLQYVFEEESAVVSNMGTLVGRWTTRVHLNLHVIDWVERLSFQGEVVVEL